MDDTKTISVLIPVFNEERTVRRLLQEMGNYGKLHSHTLEIIVVDDGSTDGTWEELRMFKESNPNVRLQLIRHDRNSGKGAAIRRGLESVTGEFVLIQDADLEYHPRDYPAMVEPLIGGHADVVYGSRFVGSRPHRVLFIWHYIGNRLLTLLSNVLTNLNLSDMETGMKAFRTEVLKGISLKENGFGFEPEVTAKVSSLPGVRMYEVGISYYGRTYAEGKKITWKDGLYAVFCVLRYNLFG